MQIRVLGAHNIESATSRMTCLLVDGVLAVDAGSLASGLTFSEQEKVRSILVTHRHYDHVKDVAAMAINFSFVERNIRVYGEADTLKAVSDHLLDGVVYPDFSRLPAANPALTYCPLEALKELEVDGYTVLPVPTNHVATVGYQVTSREGRSFFYTGDTGPGLLSCWERISPELLLIDVTLPDRLEKHAIATKHLCPRLFGEELALFRKVRGYLPRVVPIHMSPQLEDEIRGEVERVARELGADVEFAREDMTLSL